MSLRVKLFLPIAAALLLLAWLAAAHLAVAGLVLALLIAVLLTGAALGVELHAVRPLLGFRRLLGQLRQQRARSTGAEPGANEVEELVGALDHLRLQAEASERSLLEEKEARRKLDHSYGELKERYVLAVERANDGMWEWDLKTDAVEFSPRWRGMMGYGSAGPTHIEQWKALLHPDDKDGILMRLQNHIEALTPHFEAEYRVRHCDERYLWVHARGAAIRHASGKPYRMVVLDNNIEERKRLEETLIQAAEGLSAASGMDFFQALIKNLASILGTRDNIVCRCLDDPPTRVRALAYYTGGAFYPEPVEYDLAGTSCGEVIKRGEIVYVPTGVCNIWPLERDYDRDSYIGVPMFDSTGKIIGHFACMDGKPMGQDLPHLAIFKIFSVRAAAELERTVLKERLAQSIEGGRIGSA